MSFHVVHIDTTCSILHSYLRYKEIYKTKTDLQGNLVHRYTDRMSRSVTAAHWFSPAFLFNFSDACCSCRQIKLVQHKHRKLAVWCRRNVVSGGRLSISGTPDRLLGKASKIVTPKNRVPGVWVRIIVLNKSRGIFVFGFDHEMYGLSRIQVRVLPSHD
jgi:hypothetical protein